MEETLHYLLMSGHSCIRRALLSAIKDTELTMGQPKVLDYLKSHDGAVQKDIAAACHIEPATLTSVLSGMESKGLITRSMQNENRRFLYVYMTEKGRGFMQRVQHEFDIIEASALKGFTPEEISQLTALLMRVCDNLNCDDE